MNIIPFYKKIKTVLYFLLFFQLVSPEIHAQENAWNEYSFMFSKAILPLEDMTGATAIVFTGSPVRSSPQISLGGFNFRYGLTDYNSLFVSPYGFVKLGSNIIANDPEIDTSVVVALYNGTSWSASYKLSGAAPDRKIVVQYVGTMQPSGEPTKFQILLYERTGKIQFGYAQIRGFYGFSNFWHYRIFCKTNILKKNSLASVKINPNNTMPLVNYLTTSRSFDSIYANTRFTFQPDTIKPMIPSSLNFTNVQSGCVTVNISENSGNESVTVLERTDNNMDYQFEKRYYTTNGIGTTTYNYSQASLAPFWNHNYRTYVSNGFLTSDTIYKTVQTLVPQINGVKTIPGDYPSITSLLQDAVCKHLGPDLVIELQNNYSFTAEILPISFNPILQNRFIRSVIIRPAAGADITWATSTNGPIFYVDSVNHVFLDGRAGGLGESQNLTIFQQNPLHVAIQYTNAADSGGINYCRIIKKNSSSARPAIVVLPLSSAFNYPKKDINAFSITNNFISADSATVSDLIYIKPSLSSMAKNFIISGNKFSRFRTSAIHFENGGENLEIKNNTFFQPEQIRPQVFLPYTDASCITLINTEKVIIDGNFFGGGSPIWGHGKFRIDLFSNFSFINYQNNSEARKAFITNNKFGNIEASVTGTYTPKLIKASKGDVVIDNNQFGTSDSSNCITTSSFFWGIDLGYGMKTVSNNFFSGFQAGYLSAGSVSDSYFVTTSFSDSTAILNNDVGGSNNTSANSSPGIIHGIYLSSSDYNITIKKNTIRGISSRSKSVVAISGSGVISNTPQEKMEVDSNSIHHLQGSVVGGISLFLNSRVINRISHNTIYALKATDVAAGSYGPEGAAHGIGYAIYNDGEPPSQYVGEVRIFGNKIHSFESLRTQPNAVFRHQAITVSSPISKIYNNEIRLGIDSRGQNIDSVTGLYGIGLSPIDHQTFLSDKHFIEHNTIYFGGRGLAGSAISANYSLNYTSDNNLLVIGNNIINIDRQPLAGGTFTHQAYHRISAIKALSAKNLWYSSTMQNTAALLQDFKSACNCDSSSFVGNPAFINATGDSSNYNLHLTSLSKADSTGRPSPINIQTDLDDINRNAFSPIDIGCYASTPVGTDVSSRYIITLKDKAGTPFTLDAPVQYMSQRAVERRSRYKIPVDSTDLPVSPRYIDSIRLSGAVTILNTSKWLNQVAIQTSDAAALAKINNFPFVKSAAGVAAFSLTSSDPTKKFSSAQGGLQMTDTANTMNYTQSQGLAGFYNYGLSNGQVKIHQGDFLHNQGFRGQGMQIAMLDAGYYHYLTLPTFDSIRLNNQVLGTWDFVNNNASVDEDNAHGMWCLSTIAANIPGTFVGTAPKASLYLYRTEDAGSEYPIEEHFYAVGLERADSLGVEISSTSLGYSVFQGGYPGYTYADMNGNTTVSARAADLAAKKGMLLIVAAGNEGNKSWHYLITPSDADSVLSVGAVDTLGNVAAFSSYGPSSDGQQKPGVAAVGWNAAVANVNTGLPEFLSGTSFACPNMAGLATCLWQAFPEENNMGIISALQQSANKFATPDDRVGYGIPDMKKAFVILLKRFYTQQIKQAGCNTLITWAAKNSSDMSFEIERKLPSDAGYVSIFTQPGSALFASGNFNFSDDLAGLTTPTTISYRIKMNISTDTSFYFDPVSFNHANACITYTFTGNGSWNIASNWAGNNKPPLILPAGSTIIIDPEISGECILDVSQQIQQGAYFTVMPGKKLLIPGNLITL